MSKAEAASDGLIDAGALQKKLAALGKAGGGELSPKARAAVVAALKAAMADGRDKAEAMLRADGRGSLCARRLSDLQDGLIQVIHDFATTFVYPPQNRSTAERMSVTAVGGYGRGTLAPGSDVDLLFLLPYKQTPWGESVVEFILYMLWDLGLKVGHATRSVDECIRLARSDMTIRTAVLEARYIWGDRDLHDTLVARFDAEVVKGTGPEFIAAKLAERDARHRAQGASRYLVEPNVKDGKGGLRDLHTLFWIGKYFYRVRSREELVKAGVFSRAELTRFRKCEDFLWAVRCHLHFMTGRPEERLSFDLQREMAVRLGYTAHPGLKDVERFMKHYFLIAKDVGDLTRIFVAALEERHGKPVSALNRFLGLPRRRHPPRKIPGTTDFVVDHDRINIADETVFARDPVNLIRIFHLADKHDLAFHPDAMKQVARSLGLIDNALREDEEANRLFIETLTSRNQPEVVLRRMNEAGVLGRFVPDFGRIVAMMQFNMYHHYTVDEHLIRAIGVLAEIDRGDLAEAHPLANEIVGSIQERTALYLALFIHDIAKGRPEDHSVAGARVARRLGAALRPDPAADRDRRLAGRAPPPHVDHRPVARPQRPQDHPRLRRRGAEPRPPQDAPRADRRRHQGGRPRRVERLEGPVAAHALLRDRADPHRRPQPGEPQSPRRRRQGGARRGAVGMAGAGRRRLPRSPLPGLLAARRPAAQDHPCRIHPRGRPHRPPAGRQRDAAGFRGGHRDHHPGARPSAPALGDRRRLHHRRRQHRRRADLYHHRRSGPRHHLHLARVRRRGRRASPGIEGRRPHRKGDVRERSACRRRSPPSPTARPV